MRESATPEGNSIPFELQSIYQRIDANAFFFGMSAREVEKIKLECKIAYQHKLFLEKVQAKQKK